MTPELLNEKGKAPVYNLSDNARRRGAEFMFEMSIKEKKKRKRDKEANLQVWKNRLWLFTKVISLEQEVDGNQDKLLCTWGGRGWGKRRSG